MGMDLVAVFAQTPSEPPTVDLGPVLLLVAVVFIAYVIVSHIKEILTFLLMVALVLMLLGGFYVAEIFQAAFETPPEVPQTVEPLAPPPSAEVY
jgi:ABC-type amino acid transport system permease subunit